jgi:ADP-heptose:LPS heptosyltransferase
MVITFICNNSIGNIFDLTKYPNIKVITNIFPYEFPNYDFKIYSLSMPYKLGLNTIEPNHANYIKTRPEKLLYWKTQMKPLKKFKVGFVYNGFLESYLEKTIQLEEFKILLDLDIDLICIQRKTEIQKDIETISYKDKLVYYDIDTEEPFIDTIHILQNIDLLITIDTYIVHLAGVLGVNTWLLLGKVSEWRWSTDDKSYWYNTVDIMRGKEINNLKAIMPEVKDRLEDLINRNNINSID